MELTHRNWMGLVAEGRENLIRKAPCWPPTRLPPREFHEALDESMNLLMDQLEHVDTLNFFLSGGLDGEITLRYLASVPSIADKLVVNHIRLVDRSGQHLNPEETESASIIINSMGLRDVTHVEDFLDGASEELLDLSRNMGCTQPVYLMLMNSADRILRAYDPEKVAFIAAGEVYVQRHWDSTNILRIQPPVPAEEAQREGKWYFIFREDEDGCFYRWSQHRGCAFYNDIFSFTPRLLRAYLGLSDVQRVLNGSEPHKLSLISSKYRIFESLRKWRVDNPLGSEFDELWSLPFTSKYKRTGYEGRGWHNYNLMKTYAKVQTENQPLIKIEVPILENTNDDH